MRSGKMPVFARGSCMGGLLRRKIRLQCAAILLKPLVVRRERLCSRASPHQPLANTLAVFRYITVVFSSLIERPRGEHLFKSRNKLPLAIIVPLFDLLWLPFAPAEIGVGSLIWFVADVVVPLFVRKVACQARSGSGNHVLRLPHPEAHMLITTCCDNGSVRLRSMRLRRPHVRVL